MNTWQFHLLNWPEVGPIWAISISFAGIAAPLFMWEAKKTFKEYHPPWLGNKTHFVPHSPLKAPRQLLFKLKSLLQYLTYTEE